MAPSDATPSSKATTSSQSTTTSMIGLAAGVRVNAASFHFSTSTKFHQTNSQPCDECVLWNLPCDLVKPHCSGCLHRNVKCITSPTAAHSFDGYDPYAAPPPTTHPYYYKDEPQQPYEYPYQLFGSATDPLFGGFSSSSSFSSAFGDRIVEDPMEWAETPVCRNCESAGLTWCDTTQKSCEYFNPTAVAGWDYPTAPPPPPAPIPASIPEPEPIKEVEKEDAAKMMMFMGDSGKDLGEGIPSPQQHLGLVIDVADPSTPDASKHTPPLECHESDSSTSGVPPSTPAPIISPTCLESSLRPSEVSLSSPVPAPITSPACLENDLRLSVEPSPTPAPTTPPIYHETESRIPEPPSTTLPPPIIIPTHHDRDSGARPPSPAPIISPTTIQMNPAFNSIISSLACEYPARTVSRIEERQPPLFDSAISLEPEVEVETSEPETIINLEVQAEKPQIPALLLPTASDVPAEPEELVEELEASVLDISVPTEPDQHPEELQTPSSPARETTAPPEAQIDTVQTPLSSHPSELDVEAEPEVQNEEIQTPIILARENSAPLETDIEEILSPVIESVDPEAQLEEIHTPSPSLPDESAKPEVQADELQTPPSPLLEESSAPFEPVTQAEEPQTPLSSVACEINESLNIESDEPKADESESSLNRESSITPEVQPKDLQTPLQPTIPTATATVESSLSAPIISSKPPPPVSVKQASEMLQRLGSIISRLAPAMSSHASSSKTANFSMQDRIKNLDLASLHLPAEAENKISQSLMKLQANLKRKQRDESSQPPALPPPSRRIYESPMHSESVSLHPPSDEGYESPKRMEAVSSMHQSEPELSPARPIESPTLEDRDRDESMDEENEEPAHDVIVDDDRPVHDFSKSCTSSPRRRKSVDPIMESPIVVHHVRVEDSVVVDDGASGFEKGIMSRVELDVGLVSGKEVVSRLELDQSRTADLIVGDKDLSEKLRETSVSEKEVAVDDESILDENDIVMEEVDRPVVEAEVPSENLDVEEDKEASAEIDIEVEDSVSKSQDVNEEQEDELSVEDDVLHQPVNDILEETASKEDEEIDFVMEEAEGSVAEVGVVLEDDKPLDKEALAPVDIQVEDSTSKTQDIDYEEHLSVGVDDILQPSLEYDYAPETPLAADETNLVFESPLAKPTNNYEPDSPLTSNEYDITPESPLSAHDVEAPESPLSVREASCAPESPLKGDFAPESPLTSNEIDDTTESHLGDEADDDVPELPLDEVSYLPESPQEQFEAEVVVEVDRTESEDFAPDSPEFVVKSPILQETGRSVYRSPSHQSDQLNSKRQHSEEPHYEREMSPLHLAQERSPEEPYEVHQPQLEFYPQYNRNQKPLVEKRIPAVPIEVRDKFSEDTDTETEPQHVYENVEQLPDDLPSVQSVHYEFDEEGDELPRHIEKRRKLDDDVRAALHHDIFDADLSDCESLAPTTPSAQVSPFLSPKSFGRSPSPQRTETPLRDDVSDSGTPSPIFAVATKLKRVPTLVQELSAVPAPPQITRKPSLETVTAQPQLVRKPSLPTVPAPQIPVSSSVSSSAGIPPSRPVPSIVQQSVPILSTASSSVSNTLLKNPIKSRPPKPKSVSPKPVSIPVSAPLPASAPLAVPAPLPPPTQAVPVAGPSTSAPVPPHIPQPPPIIAAPIPRPPIPPNAHMPYGGYHPHGHGHYPPPPPHYQHGHPYPPPYPHGPHYPPPPEFHPATHLHPPVNYPPGAVFNRPQPVVNLYRVPMPVIPSNQPIDPVLLARFNGSMKNAVQAMQVMQLMQSGLTLAQCMVKLLPIPQEGEPKRVLKSGKCYILNPQTGLKEFFCPVCYKPYTTSNGLRYHIKYLHSNSRGFPEGYRFGDTGDLGQDGGPLVGESEDEEDDVAGPSKDLFECMSPGCGKKYGSLNGLRYHAKRCGLPKGSVPNDYQPKSNKKKMAIAALIQAGAAQMAAQNAASGSGLGVVIPTMPIPMAAGPSVQMNVGTSSGSGANPLDSLSFLATVATADAARTVSSAKPPSVVTAASTSTVSSTKPSSASVAAASVAAAAKAADLAAAKAAQIAAAAAAANAAAKAANEAARAANIAAANAQAAAIAARRKRTAELVWGDGSELSDVSDVSSDEED